MDIDAGSSPRVYIKFVKLVENNKNNGQIES